MSYLPSVSRHRIALGGLLLLWSTVSAVAIQPQRWTHSTEADFAAGETEGLVITNLGDLKVATTVEALADMPEDITVIYDVIEMNGVAMVAAGPEARLLAVKADQVTELIRFEGYQLFSMLPIPGTSQITLALSGETSKLTQVNVEADAASIVREIELPEVRYIWDMTTRNDRRELVLATGVDGKVLSLDDTGTPTELLDTAQANVLCLAPGPAGSVYAGTDTDGLIYRIDADGSVYVVYDADEPEIGALLMARDGMLYAGTADAEQAKPGRLEEAAEDETGRPEPEALTAAEGDADTTPTDLTEEPAPQPLDAPDEAAARDAAPEAEDQSGQANDANTSSDTEAELPGDHIDEAGPPSPEQYDALREEIRKRLLAARKSGALAAGKSAQGAARTTRTARAASGSDKSGNAVYRIDPRGFVSEVFRESVMVLKLVEQADGGLLVGTGNEGQLYRVDVATGETSVINDLESQQLLAVSESQEGAILVGGANPAGLHKLTPETAESGGYTSDILDAGQISLWGTFLVTAEFPQGGRIQNETRSGNVADPEIAAWSSWEPADSVDVPANTVLDHPLEAKIKSPPARYLQYRLTLAKGRAGDDIGGGASAPASPIVTKVELAYVTPNLQPALTSLNATYPDFPGVDEPASPTMSISWEATDDNGDRLLYNLDYKPAAAATDQAWLGLAEDLTDTSFEWDTRKVPDGRYRLRVTADDRLDNPGDMALTAGRLADPVLVDNTPPMLEESMVQQSSDPGVEPASAKFSGIAADRFSPIHSVAYSLDGAEEYTPVLPDDLIYDSTNEAWSATLRGLSFGSHAVTVRVIDVRGNASYTSKLFEIK